jgi:hypothetical protein
MMGKVLETTVDIGLISAGTFNGRLEVVRYYGLGNSLVELQSVGAAFDQVFAFLAPAGLHIGVMAIGKDGDEDLHIEDLPGTTVHDLEFLSGKIDEKFMTGGVLEFHGAFVLCIFTVVMFHKLGVAIRVVHLLDVFPIVEEIGEPGMVPGLVHPLEIAAQLVKTPIVDSGMGSEQGLQDGVIAGR